MSLHNTTVRFLINLFNYQKQVFLNGFLQWSRSFNEIFFYYITFAFSSMASLTIFLHINYESIRRHVPEWGIALHRIFHSHSPMFGLPLLDGY